MSPRAACRLERLGYQPVYDYIDGIADWKAAGLPTEGTAPPVQRVGDATRTDVPTCTPDQSIDQARERTFNAGWDECIVVDCGTIVIGRLRTKAWDADGPSIVEDVMEPGPTTVRPDALLQPLVERMAKRNTKLVTVTTAQGHLVGVLLRDEAEQFLAGPPPEQMWQGCDGCRGQWTMKGSLEEVPANTSS